MNKEWVSAHRDTGASMSTEVDRGTCKKMFFLVFVFRLDVREKSAQGQGKMEANGASK